ncbi:PLASTID TRANSCRIPTIONALLY ACTIVE protein 6, chloroplastic isoform X2 [Malania oleifera]|uniref:PLASTID TRANSCRIPTIONALLY ACTIVE protein 6, chloroplastic isoform X2 n=1 Tax=Malania oleifera TaxID=397392 RepID=UPI0025AEA19E|nr:PLASTID TRANSCRIPTIONALLY ACTIVE protein 6, chloroplastic isoform X2 [Malania oleifera]
MRAGLIFLPPPPLPTPKLLTTAAPPPPLLRSPSRPFLPAPTQLRLNSRGRDFRVRSDEGDVDVGGLDDYDMDDDDEVVEYDNKKDFDVDYEPLASSSPLDDIEMVQSKSFMSTQGWDPDMVVDYKINEEEFHKISLFDCDFFIRKPPDPDNDVYDFREMYVTPPDTDVYAIPKVLAPMPKKYIRCAMTDYGCYNVTEPPIDAPRDPLYKSERQIFLTKHYRNRRFKDPEFVLDFEEIYVIDSKTKSITRAKILVTVPGGRNRDRKADLLIIRDNGNSFKIIHRSQREDADTIIEKEEWAKSRQEMETHLRKLRDFNISNWF